MGMDVVTGFIYGIESKTHENWDKDYVEEICKEYGLTAVFAGDRRDYEDECSLVMGIVISTGEPSLDEDSGSAPINWEYMAQQIEEAKKRLTQEMINKIHEVMGHDIENRKEPTVIHWLNITA